MSIQSKLSILIDRLSGTEQLDQLSVHLIAHLRPCTFLTEESLGQLTNYVNSAVQYAKGGEEFRADLDRVVSAARDYTRMIVKGEMEADASLNPGLINWEAVQAQLPPLPTRKGEEQDLAAKGVTGPLADLLLKKSAPARAAARVAYVAAAFKAAFEAGYPALPEYAPTDRALWVWASVEARGVGGSMDTEGAGTARGGVGSLLGSGRKHARDGEAWKAAIASAGEAARLNVQGIPGWPAGYVLADVSYDPANATPGVGGWRHAVNYGGTGLILDHGDRLETWFLGGPASLWAELLSPRHLRAEAVRVAELAMQRGDVELAQKASAAYAGWTGLITAQNEERNALLGLSIF
jgi:hypothetical protein